MALPVLRSLDAIRPVTFRLGAQRHLRLLPPYPARPTWCAILSCRARQDSNAGPFDSESSDLTTRPIPRSHFELSRTHGRSKIPQTTGLARWLGFDVCSWILEFSFLRTLFESHSLRYSVLTGLYTIHNISSATAPVPCPQHASGFYRLVYAELPTQLVLSICCTFSLYLIV